MEDIAVQLFKLGDQEHKGFIVKRDMQRLQSEVELPPDQLEAVFESLDSSHNGYLTLDQFLAGVNHFGNDRGSVKQAVSETDLSIQQLLNLNVLHKSGELMYEVRGLVGREDTWHQLLAALFSDLNQLLRQISHLEDTLKSRDHHHQEELRRLYDELESQLSEERERLHKQLCQREARLRTELTAELTTKENQITELMEQRDELQDRLHAAQSQLNSKPCCSLQTHSQEKHESVNKQSHYITEERSRNLLQVQRSYAEGFSHAQHLATLQEDSLVKQLRLLQEMQETLKSELKQDKHKELCYDGL